MKLVLSSPTMNQLCKVCGEPAAGYHFGAFTCEGCKSFFGRTYNNLSALGECKNNGQCVINKKNRTSCKSCRLKKCLVVGMSKSGSRYGRRSNWFKIHCLIQDQAEMTRLGEQGMLSGMYDTKDFTDSGGSATSPSGTASPTEPNAAKSPLAFSSPFDPKMSHFEGSPPFDRKDTIVFHHPLPLSPVSPMSPLNHANKFFFQPPGSAFFSKSYNRISKLCNGSADLSSYSPHRYVTVAALNPLVRPKAETSPMDCYADTPEQDRPMDLTVKKSAESPDSDVTIITESPFFPSDECSESNREARATESPLDLTKREATTAATATAQY